MTNKKFNNGKVYHGSDDVTEGKLRGETCQTDYFYARGREAAEHHGFTRG